MSDVPIIEKNSDSRKIERNDSFGKITDADIELQHELTGLEEVSRSREFHSTLSLDAIRNFSLSIGDDNPLFTDENYAKKTRWGGVIAPSIMTAIVNEPLLGKRIPKEIKKKTRALFKGCQTFMSGGTWHWYRPIYAGDTLYSFESEDSVEVKPSEFGGRTVHIYHRYVKINQRAEVVGVYRSLRIIAERETARKKGKYKETKIASYDDEAIEKIDHAYLNEKPRGSECLFWEDVNEGNAIPTLQKGPLTVTDIILTHCAGYGMAPYRMLATSRIAAKDRIIYPLLYTKNSQGFPDTGARVHWEPASAKEVGNPEAYDWGLLREFWLYHALTDWAGDDGFVVSMHDEIRKFNYIGDMQSLTGQVLRTYQKDGRNLVDLKVISTNQRGEETAIAEATIALASCDTGPVMLPDVPKDLQIKAIAFMAEHNRLKNS